MNKNKIINKYSIFYPEIVSLKGLIKVNPKIKNSNINSFVKGLSKKDYFTYYFFKRELDLIVYPNIYDKLHDVVPVTEYCRTHYLKNNCKGSRIYINSKHFIVLRIEDGLVLNYSKCKDESSLIEYAKQIEVSARVHGEDSLFFFDKYLESFDGHVINYNDPDVIKDIKDFQVINKTTGIKKILNSLWPKNKEIKKDNVLQSDIGTSISKTSLALFLFLLADMSIGGYFLYEEIKFQKEGLINFKKSQDGLNKELKGFSSKTNKQIETMGDKIIKDISLLNEKIGSLTLSSSKGSPGVDVNDIYQIKNDLRKLRMQNERLMIQLEDYQETKEKKQKSNSIKGAVKNNESRGSKIVYSKDIPHFYCIPLIINDKSVYCEYKGQKLKIGDKFSWVDDRKVRYDANKKAFVSIVDNKVRVTPLSIAKRGF